MKRTMANDRMSSRIDARKQPTTPETVCSSEQHRDRYPKSRIVSKVQIFESIMSPKSELTMNRRTARVKKIPVSPQKRVSIDHLGDHETLASSIFTQSDRNMDDHNSIIASTQDDHSIRSLDYSLPNFDIFDVFGQEDDLSCDIKVTDSEIQAVIDDIRKEASNMDAILLLDQVKSLESELEAVNKQFSARSSENEDLKMQLEEKRDQLAKAELERDLHQADVTKLREDLKTCVGKMFDISLYESAFGDDASQKDALSPGKTVPKAPENEPSNSIASPSQPKTMRILGLAPQPRRIINKLPVFA